MVSVLVRRGLTADERLLTPVEARALARSGYRWSRRDDWIRGRLLARVALSRVRVYASVDSASDGAPVVVDADAHVSISHDGELVAAAAAGAGRRVGVDVCLHAHEARAERAFRRIAVHLEDVEPVEAWASLECVIKLRRQSVVVLLARRSRVESRAGAVRVTGLGAPVRVQVWRTPEWVLAWAVEAA